MEEQRQEMLRKDLIKQRETLVSEVNNLESQLKFKRDYLMKIIGGLETIDLLFGPDPATSEEQSPIKTDETSEEPIVD
jgi:hypothetical protein